MTANPYWWELLVPKNGQAGKSKKWEQSESRRVTRIIFLSKISSKMLLSDQDRFFLHFQWRIKCTFLHLIQNDNENDSFIENARQKALWYTAYDIHSKSSNPFYLQHKVTDQRLNIQTTNDKPHEEIPHPTVPNSKQHIRRSVKTSSLKNILWSGKKT